MGSGDDPVDVAPCRRRLVFAAALTRSASILDDHVLLLNAHYAALRVVSVRRAFALLFKQDPECRPVAEVVHIEDGRYVSYNFEDWAELSAFKREFEPAKHDWIRTVRFDLVVPRIVRVLTFSKLPRHDVKFNRRNIFARDHNTCQYCGTQTRHLTLDHIIPRYRGGEHSWENVVSACVACNRHKAGRTPQEAHMKLIKKPAPPGNSHSYIIPHQYLSRRDEWRKYLPTHIYQ